MKSSIKSQILSIAVAAGLLVTTSQVQAQRFRHAGATHTSVTHVNTPRGSATHVEVDHAGATVGGRGYYPPPPRPIPGPRPVPVRPVPVPVPVPRPVPVPVPAFHHPYYYHPFTPYYWGPTWHPVGFFVATIATTAIIVSVADAHYHYEQGVYYEEASGGGYKVVPAPVGAEISSLPDGYTKLTVSGATYYYYGGAYYSKSSSKYKVVAAPAGAVVSQLPEGATETTVDGKKYLLYNGTYYEPIAQDGHDAYVVTETK